MIKILRNLLKKREVVTYAVIQHCKEASEFGISTEWTKDFLKEIFIIKSDGRKDSVTGIMDFNEDTIENLRSRGMSIFDGTSGEEIPNGRLGVPLPKVVRGIFETHKLIGD